MPDRQTASNGNVCATDNMVHYDNIGLYVFNYSDTQIGFLLGSAYGGGLDDGTPFTLTVAGVTCSAMASFSDPVYCQNSTWVAAQTLSQTGGV